MNRAYRTVWNAALGICVAVAENVRAPRGRARAPRRVVGASAALAVAVTASGASQAATFTAANEAELNSAIAAANASADPISTISLTASMAITAPLPPIGANVTVATNGFLTAIGSAAGAALDLRSGATYQGANIQVGSAAGTSGSLTLQGASASMSGNVFQALAGRSSIRVLDGATLSNTSGIQLGGTTAASAGGVADVLISGTGSTWTSGVSYTQHRGTLEVSGGGTLLARGGVLLGRTAGGTVTAVVTGAGSGLRTTSANISLGLEGEAALTVAEGATVVSRDGNGPIGLGQNASGSGTLNIGAAVGEAPAAPGTVVALAINGGAGTAVLNFNHNASNYEFAVPITGRGTVNHVGTGLTNLTGDSSAFTGTTNVANGTLAVNGVLGGSVNVIGAGRLQGSGAVGSLNVAGTVAPGNSIGTLNVNGNFVQAAGATYQVEVDPASNASDLIHASGSASIASGARLNVVRTSGADYVVGNRYTVLTADGGVTGTYSLTGDTQTAFVQLRDSYDANHVYVSPEKVRSFTDAAGTPNQVAVATALESLPDSNGLVHAVTWLPNDFAARDAFNQLSVDIHASTKTAMLEDSRFVREAAIDRLRASNCAPGAPQQAGEGCVPEGQQRTAWGQVFGSWGHIDGNGNAAKLKRDIGGFVVGADTGVGAGWRVGALGGYSRASADTDARNSSAKTDSYHLGLYGGTQWGATSLRLGASHTWNKTDTSRAVAFAGFADSVSAKYDSGTTQLFGEVGHRIDAGAVALEPFAGLAHVRVKSDAFFERGGLAALYGDGGSVDATFSTLGVRASTQLGERTRLRGLLGWRHAFGDTVPTSTHAFGGSLPFTIAGVPLAKNVAVLEAGVETQLKPNLTLGASYSGQFGDGLQDHGFKVHLNWAF